MVEGRGCGDQEGRGLEKKGQTCGYGFGITYVEGAGHAAKETGCVNPNYVPMKEIELETAVAEVEETHKLTPNTPASPGVPVRWSCTYQI